MLALVALLLLHGAAPPDAGTFIRNFDELVRARKPAGAAPLSEAPAASCGIPNTRPRPAAWNPQPAGGTGTVD